MKKTSGSLFKRGNVWVVVWQADGKRYKKSTGTGLRREAERIRDEILAPFRLEDKAATFKNLVERYQDSQTRVIDETPGVLLTDTWSSFETAPNRPTSSPQTLEQYKFQWLRFQRWLESKHPNHTELRHVTEVDAAAYAIDLAKAVGPSTFNRHVTLLRCLFRVLAKPAKMAGNPFSEIKLKKAVQCSRRELTIEELRRVCGTATGELQTLLAIGLYTGLRLADAVTLTWGDVDLVRRFVTNKNRKTGKLVHIPIHKDLLTILAQTPENTRKGEIIPELCALYRKSRELVTNKIQKHFADCGVRVHAPGTGPKTNKRAVIEVGYHSLRHSFVSMNAAAGTPLAMMQSLVGHSNPAMTRHYVHENLEAVSTAIRALPSVMDAADNGTATPPLLPAGMPLKERLREIIQGMTANTLKQDKARLLEALEQG